MIPAEARGAWREIEAQLRPYVARRVPSADVDDVLQETLLRAFRGLPALSEEERFGPWVYRVAASAIVDHQRRGRRHPVVDGERRERAEETPTAEEDSASDLGACVARFVARLPSPYREAVTLTELEGLTQKDAAELVGVSLSGMKSRVQRGRERLLGMFHDCCEIAVDCRGHVTDCAPRDSNDS